MDIFNGQHVNGALNARADIIEFKVRIEVPDDRLERQPLFHQFENVLDRYARAGDTRLPKVNRRIGFNSTKHAAILADIHGTPYYFPSGDEARSLRLTGLASRAGLWHNGGVRRVHHP